MQENKENVVAERDLNNRNGVGSNGGKCKKCETLIIANGELIQKLKKVNR